jgi:hypothetical protein
VNALEIIEQIREHDAEVVLENKRLLVRGRGERLPATLRTALHVHKAEIMIALGGPADVALAEVITEIRPYLDRALQQLPDSKILVLVNWSIMHALAKSVARFRIDDD